MSPALSQRICQLTRRGSSTIQSCRQMRMRPRFGLHAAAVRKPYLGMTSFNLFQHENYKAFQQRYPEAGNHPKFMNTLLGRAWQQLDENEKDVYRQRVMELKETKGVLDTPTRDALQQLARDGTANRRKPQLVQPDMDSLFERLDNCAGLSDTELDDFNESAGSDSDGGDSLHGDWPQGGGTLLERVWNLLDRVERKDKLLHESHELLVDQIRRSDERVSKLVQLIGDMRDRRADGRELEHIIGRDVEPITPRKPSTQQRAKASAAPSIDRECSTISSKNTQQLDKYPTALNTLMARNDPTQQRNSASTISSVADLTQQRQQDGAALRQDSSQQRDMDSSRALRTNAMLSSVVDATQQREDPDAALHQVSTQQRDHDDLHTNEIISSVVDTALQPIEDNAELPSEDICSDWNSASHDELFSGGSDSEDDDSELELESEDEEEEVLQYATGHRPTEPFQEVPASCRINQSLADSDEGDARWPTALDPEEEQKLRESKALNVVVGGLLEPDDLYPEGFGKSPTPDYRVIADCLEHCGLGDDAVIKVYRVGAPDSDAPPRIVKVVFADHQSKDTFLEGFNSVPVELRNGAITADQDLTLQQRMENAHASRQQPLGSGVEPSRAVPTLW